MATDQISIRIDHATKAAAEKVFSALGLSPTDAVRMFYKQVTLHRGLPFPAKIPNAETLAAFKEVDEGGGTTMSLKEFKKYMDSIKA
ncbi:MAG: type II toxin-antitoxin system RelB/DinJ family antitoxin [Alphaproteobacteria bacterium]|nr:type II toxin-antitoxin system RelB/DinJ family antitoxin [Alphaproteobacteria bacterium]